MNHIYFLLIPLIYFSTNSENKEISEIQFNEFDQDQDENITTNDDIYFSITLLYGVNDSEVVQIEGGNSSSLTQNFTIEISQIYGTPNFRSSVELAIIVVIEILDTQLEEICYLENDIFIELTTLAGNSFRTHICEKLTYTDHYGKYVNVFEDPQVLVHANLNNFLGAIRITATSTRINVFKNCFRDFFGILEMPCQINGQTWCLNQRLECNGELNCGDRNQSDENPRLCHRYSKEVMVMALYGIIMVIIVLFIAVQVLRICLYYTPQLPRLSLMPSKDNVLLLDLESQSLPPSSPQYSETKTMRNLEMINRINAAKSSVENLPPNNLEKKARQKLF